MMGEENRPVGDTAAIQRLWCLQCVDMSIPTAGPQVRRSAGLQVNASSTFAVDPEDWSSMYLMKSWQPCPRAHIVNTLKLN
jgi:hypothetical protein